MASRPRLGDYYCGIYLKLNRTGFDWRNTSFEVNLTTADTSNILGGIFAFDTLNRTGIVSVKTVLYMTLSGYLAECTGELKYTETALQCAHFIKTWMIDPTTSLIKDCTIDVKAVQELSGAVLSCHLTGAVIEGFSVLASVTSDDEWRTLAIDISKAAMKYNEWHSGDGILTVGTGGNPSENTDIKAMKGLLNHGLMVAYQRNRSNEPFCNLIRSYINVQFNALYDWARFHNKYGVDWRGPFIGPYPHGQIAAVDTLVAAIGVND